MGGEDANVNFYLKKGEEYELKNDLANALRYYNKILLKDSKNVLAMLKIGKIYYKMGDYQSAIKYLEKLISVNPKCLEAYYYLWNSYGKLGNYRKSWEYINKALRIDSNYDKALKMKRTIKHKLNEIKKLGLEYYNKKEYNKALSYFKEYVQIINNNWIIFSCIGDCYFNLKDYKKCNKQL